MNEEEIVRTKKTKRQEHKDWVGDVHRVRSKRDVTKLFFVPYLPVDSPVAPQPTDMTVSLFPYQRRAVARMMRIEEGVSLSINNTVVKPRGGVACDAVGMGKTAEILALCMLRQCPPESLVHNQIKGNLIICPEHLCGQWIEEALKLAPTLKLLPCYENRHISRADIETADLIVVSMNTFLRGSFSLTEHGGVTVEPIRAYSYCRIIVDECHDAVALGAAATKSLAATTCLHFWCVSGTPFPQGDASAYGINQLLHIRVKFHLSNNIFALPNSFLPPDHPFEVLKRVVYVRNDGNASTCARIASTEETTGSQPASAYSIEVVDVNFSRIEWAFYKEESRQIYSRNIFSDSFNALRQLCCHPACSTKWMTRLTGVSAGVTSRGSVTLSLDQLRKKMVRWKKEDILVLEREISEDKSNIVNVLNSIALIFDLYPGLTRDYCNIRVTLEVTPEENEIGHGPPLTYDITARCRVRENGVYSFERASKSRRLLSELERDEAKHAIEVHINYVNEARERTAEIKDNARQAQLFESMKERLEGDAVQDSSPRRSTRLSSKPEAKVDEPKGLEDMVNVEQTEEPKLKTANCLICLEDVHVLASTSCGHWACERCLLAWVGNNNSCPTCRKDITTADLTMVDIQAPSEGRGDAVDPDTPEIENYGSKPWKVMQYCRQVLDKDSAARILIFSSYDESLKVMSDALQQKHIHSLSCGFSGEKVADTIDRFKAPGCRERVLLMNSNDSAAGTNLQLASYVLFLEPAGIHVSHAVAIETQAIGRTVRLGQTRHVKVVYFIMKETVEEEIYKALCVGRLEKQQRDGLHPTLAHSSDPSAAEGCVSSSSEKQCPICARKFKSSSMNAEINAHIDACLAQQS